MTESRSKRDEGNTSSLLRSSRKNTTQKGEQDKSSLSDTSTTEVFEEDVRAMAMLFEACNDIMQKIQADTKQAQDALKNLTRTIVNFQEVLPMVLEEEQSPNPIIRSLKQSSNPISIEITGDRLGRYKSTILELVGRVKIKHNKLSLKDIMIIFFSLMPTDEETFSKIKEIIVQSNIETFENLKDILALTFPLSVKLDPTYPHEDAIYYFLLNVLVYSKYIDMEKLRNIKMPNDLSTEKRAELKSKIEIDSTPTLFRDPNIMNRFTQAKLKIMNGLSVAVSGTNMLRTSQSPDAEIKNPLPERYSDFEVFQTLIESEDMIKQFLEKYLKIRDSITGQTLLSEKEKEQKITDDFILTMYLTISNGLVFSKELRSVYNPKKIAVIMCYLFSKHPELLKSRKINAKQFYEKIREDFFEGEDRASLENILRQNYEIQNLEELNTMIKIVKEGGNRLILVHGPRLLSLITLIEQHKKKLTSDVSEISKELAYSLNLDNTSDAFIRTFLNQSANNILDCFLVAELKNYDKLTNHIKTITDCMFSQGLSMEQQKQIINSLIDCIIFLYRIKIEEIESHLKDIELKTTDRKDVKSLSEIIEERECNTTQQKGQLTTRSQSLLPVAVVSHKPLAASNNPDFSSSPSSKKDHPDKLNTNRHGLNHGTSSHPEDEETENLSRKTHHYSSSVHHKGKRKTKNPLTLPTGTASENSRSSIQTVTTEKPSGDSEKTVPSTGATVVKQAKQEPSISTEQNSEQHYHPTQSEITSNRCTASRGTQGYHMLRESKTPTQTTNQFGDMSAKLDASTSAAAIRGQSLRSQSTRIEPTHHQPKNSILANSFLGMVEARRDGKSDVDATVVQSQQQ